jgi:hypothetical protein
VILSSPSSEWGGEGNVHVVSIGQLRVLGGEGGVNFGRG